MKKLLSILLSVVLLLTMAGAETVNTGSVNLGYLLELTRRVDVLLRSDRMASDFVSERENGISEKQLLTNLRRGDRTNPSAVYLISQEELESKLIGDNPAYTRTTSQVKVLTEMVQNWLTEEMSDYAYSLTVHMARTTHYVAPEGEAPAAVAFVLYEDALPILMSWHTVDGMVSLNAYPLFDEKLAAATTAEEVTAWLVEKGLPELICTPVDMTNAEAIAFPEDFFTEAGEPLPFALLAEMADEMEEEVRNGYLQATWGYTDEDVSMLDELLHGDAQPAHIYRVDVMNTSSMQMVQLFYRNELPQVQYEAMCTVSSEMLQSMLQSMQSAFYQKADEVLYPSDEDEAESLVEEEKPDDIFTDEETWQERYQRYREELQRQQARYSMVMRAHSLRMKLNLSEQVPAIYLLVYETGAPIAVLHSPEFGISSFQVVYIAANQLQRSKNISDVKLYLNSIGLNCLVTEVLPQETTDALTE